MSLAISVQTMKTVYHEGTRAVLGRPLCGKGTFVLSIGDSAVY